MQSVVMLIAGFAAAAGAGIAAAQTKPACDSPTPGYDTVHIKCVISTGTAQRFRFKANFSGGHDDTTASMSATLNGASLICEKDSKTSLMGEDGDVSLDCRFSIAEKAGAQHTLGVTLSWRHAQYKDFELLSD